MKTCISKSNARGVDGQIIMVDEDGSRTQQEPEKKQSQWLFLPKKLKDHKHEIEPFVECYLTFFGGTGLCNSCVAQKLCARLNELIKD